MRPDEEILEFWFGAPDDENYGQYRAVWFQPDEAFVNQARERFADDYERAKNGDLDDWQETPRGALALILLLDQFSFLFYPNTARAFEADEAARRATKLALERGFDQEFPEVFRWFFYLPLEHSENLEDQHRAVELFRALPQNETNATGLEYAIRHLRVIERFGRFPNRNAALGRKSTPEEEEFLAGPDAPF
jgi:uncharacterized protein (DUF924 family)